MMEGSGTLEEQLAAIGIKVRHPTFLPIFFTCCVIFQLLITTAISDRKVISLINSCHTCWTSLILFAFRTFPMRCKRAHLPLDLDRHGTLFETILQFSNKVFTF